MAAVTAVPAGMLNVRMYNVGFGDCFLLSFPVEGGHRHVLVDCGAHSGGTLGNLHDVAENVRAVTDGRLTAVVATHRHQDHIWGFERGRDVFREMTVDEVWLPWVEDLTKSEARNLWKKHASARAAVEARLALAPAGPRRDAVAAVLANLKPNEVALNELRTRFGAGKQGVQYLHGGQDDLVAPAGIEGLHVKVLGPPKSEAFLKQMNPPKAERWELAAAPGSAGANLFESPFDARWDDPAADAYWAKEEATRVFDPKERALFREAMSDALDLAFALEDAVNNSSLALLFLFGGQGLLMPGDAQWGNWRYWMEQAVAPELFEQVTLYKVGHHGSHNATPKSVIERLPKNVAVLVPTQGDKPFPTIPEPKLLAALEARSGDRVVRSDGTGPLPDGFERGAFWIDYRLRPEGR
jgi:beta-lactamase superfamily II metal-dependent hydrolase